MFQLICAPLIHLEWILDMWDFGLVSSTIFYFYRARFSLIHISQYIFQMLISIAKVGDWNSNKNMHHKIKIFSIRLCSNHQFIFFLWNDNITWHFLLPLYRHCLDLSKIKSGSTITWVVGFTSWLVSFYLLFWIKAQIYVTF